MIKSSWTRYFKVEDAVNASEAQGWESRLSKHFLRHDIALLDPDFQHCISQHHISHVTNFELHEEFSNLKGAVAVIDLISLRAACHTVCSAVLPSPRTLMV